MRSELGKLGHVTFVHWACQIRPVPKAKGIVMSSKSVMASALVALGLVISTGAGCSSVAPFGPTLGVLAIPIPVSPLLQNQMEDRFCSHERSHRYIKLLLDRQRDQNGADRRIEV